MKKKKTQKYKQILFTLKFFQVLETLILIPIFQQFNSFFFYSQVKETAAERDFITFHVKIAHKIPCHY